MDTLLLSDVGLIPARAGNTRKQILNIRSIRAHPRSRGEHTSPTCPSTCDWGSSPLARGTHAAVVGQLQQGGLIPARAGNTCLDIP